MNHPKLGHAPLFYEYRGGVLDNIHMGYVAVVDEAGRLIFSVGDADTPVFMRSSAKPIQALPVIARRLDEAYGISAEESAIFAASHAAQPHHIAALESIYAKAGFSEDDLIMKPTEPGDAEARIANRIAGTGPRKFNHNCAGKHAGILLLQRALGGPSADYWRADSAAQREILRAVSIVSETPRDQIRIGVDGCGVPVFALPIRRFAAAFKNLAAPDRIQDETLADAAARFVPRLHAYPHMISGYGRLCTLLNGDANLVAKAGAAGVYGIGLKKQRIGIAFKVSSGSPDIWGLLLHQILSALDGASSETLDGLLRFDSYELKNDNDAVVGEFVPAFEMAAALRPR